MLVRYYLRHRDKKHTIRKSLPGQPILYCGLLASLWQYICIGYPHWIPLLWQQAHSVVPFDKSNQHGHPFWDLVYFLAHWGIRAACTSSFDTQISDSKKILPRTMGNIETHPMFPCYHKIGRYQNLLVMKIDRNSWHVYISFSNNSPLISLFRSYNNEKTFIRFNGLIQTSY